MDERAYNELEHIGKAIGLNTSQTAKLGAHMFILSVKHSNIKLYLDDDTPFNELGIKALEQLSGVTIEQVIKEEAGKKK